MVAAARVSIGLAAKAGLLFVVLDGIAKAVVVYEIVTRIVGWVDIDHLDLAMITALQELQHLEIVAFDVDVVGVEEAVLAVTTAALLGGMDEAWQCSRSATGGWHPSCQAM